MRCILRGCEVTRPRIQERWLLQVTCSRAFACLLPCNAASPNPPPSDATKQHRRILRLGSSSTGDLRSKQKSPCATSRVRPASRELTTCDDGSYAQHSKPLCPSFPKYCTGPRIPLSILSRSPPEIQTMARWLLTISYV